MKYAWIALAILIGVTIASHKRSFVQVRAGDVWVYKGEEKNPFQPQFVSTNTVLAVSNGYVKYRDHRGYESSESKSWFLIGSTKIK